VDGPGAELVVDIDLAILGRDALRFMEYDSAVAEEVADTAPFAFALARGRSLARTAERRHPGLRRPRALCHGQ
jgi:predicted metal-dependent HD superfamily phosphohydrolase